eukprot:6699381-Pyramimonas_sp.AAC.1
MKLRATAQKQGWNVSEERCVEKCCMTTNLSLSYGGSTPAAALTGVQPRGLSDHENPGLVAQLGILESVPDAVETSIRLRMATRGAINAST